MKNIITILLCCLAFGVSAQSSKAYAKAIKKHRKSYKKDFLKSDHSPLDKEGLKGIAFFDTKESYKIEANFTRTPDAQPFKMATYSGQTRDYIKYGDLSFELEGKPVTLAVYQNLGLIKMPKYKEYLFIPFKDYTNDEKTYGGGRYLNSSISEIVDGKLIIDFNKAYNPYCAFSDGYSCPVPPEENHLEMEVLAGEAMYQGEKGTH